MKGFQILSLNNEDDWEVFFPQQAHVPPIYGQQWFLILIPDTAIFLLIGHEHMPYGEELYYVHLYIRLLQELIPRTWLMLNL
jgi:hypothetical protein